jgi:hypothetical protein
MIHDTSLLQRDLRWSTHAIVEPTASRGSARRLYDGYLHYFVVLKALIALWFQLLLWMTQFSWLGNDSRLCLTTECVLWWLWLTIRWVPIDETRNSLGPSRRDAQYTGDRNYYHRFLETNDSEIWLWVGVLWFELLVWIDDWVRVVVVVIDDALGPYRRDAQ